jgi:hypothetical protein
MLSWCCWQYGRYCSFHYCCASAIPGDGAVLLPEVSDQLVLYLVRLSESVALILDFVYGTYSAAFVMF